MMERILSALLEVSIYAGILILAILSFRALFYSKISPKLQYLLWGLVILRLLIPVTLESGFHVSSLFPAPVAAVESMAPMAVTTPAPVSNPIAPQIAAFPASVPTAAPRLEQPQPKPIPWQTIAFFVWVSGVVITLAFTVYARLRFARRLRHNAMASSEKARLLFSGSRNALGIRGEILLLTTRMAISPSLAVLSGKSVLILPDRLTDGDALRYAILHEMTHYKRRDHWTLLLLSLLRAVYWFNPFLWLACLEIRADMETACDARVLSLLDPTEKRGYLTTLLQLFTNELQPSLGMAQVQTRRMAKKRMKGAFMKRTTTKPVLYTAILFSLLLTVFCFTTACQPAPEKTVFTPIPTEQPITNGPSISSGVENAFTVISTDGKITPFTYRDGGTDENSFTEAPRDASKVISKEEAAHAAADQLVRVFRDEIKGGEVIVVFRNMEDLRLELYDVFLGGDSYESANYRALLDAATGDVLNVENTNLALDEQESTESPDMEDPIWDEAGDKTFAVAKQFITDHFPNQGKILDDSYYDGVQATFQTVDPICVDQYIHMEQGPSYSMRIRYPSMTIEDVSAFPLGWDYCMAQTWYYEYMHPEEARSEYSALTSGELDTVATYAASLIGQAYQSPDTKDRYQNSVLFVQNVWDNFVGATEKTREVTDITNANDMTYPAGTEIELFNDDKTDHLEAFYLADGSYVYADSATGKVEQGNFKKDFGTKFTACMVTTSVLVPRAGQYAVSIPDSAAVSVPTPTISENGMLELTPGDYVVISEAAKAMVGQDMTKALEIKESGNAWYTYGFLRYVFKSVHVAVDGEEPASIVSVTDPTLIPGRQLSFQHNDDTLYGIYVGDGKFVMLNIATNMVEELDLADALKDSAYGNFNVSTLYAPTVYR